MIARKQLHAFPLVITPRVPEACGLVRVVLGETRKCLRSFVLLGCCDLADLVIFSSQADQEMRRGEFPEDESLGERGSAG